MSAPEDDYISVHIKTLGDWTKELKNVFLKVLFYTTFNLIDLIISSYSVYS
jgi:hypothetical protein